MHSLSNYNYSTILSIVVVVHGSVEEHFSFPMDIVDV